MFNKALLFVLISATVAVPAAADASSVFTAVEVYHTIIDEPPYLVDRTTTIVWTQGPTVSAVTDVPLPTAS
ncbi:hypothetical protein H0H92_006801 [Tricholoma furcatifolium]|nr:hypothetical protein H0H92_006801 [Tricholoma furcatifolium]